MLKQTRLQTSLCITYNVIHLVMTTRVLVRRKEL